MSVGVTIEANVRPATHADVAPITAIYAGAIAGGAATAELVPPDEAEMRQRIEGMLRDGLPLLVADRRGELLGYASARPFRDRPAFRNTVEDSVYLAPKSRSVGIGGLLLRRLIEEAAAAQFRQMLAIIGDSENEASLRLHKAAGFAHIGTLKSVGFKRGRWFDAVIMQRPIGPGADEKPSR